jgi:hypothetical protein
MALQPYIGPWPLLHLHTVGRTSWTGDQPIARLLPTHRTTQTQNTEFMIRVVLKPTIPAFERAKTLYTNIFDRAPPLWSAKCVTPVSHDNTRRILIWSELNFSLPAGAFRLAMISTVVTSTLRSCHDPSLTIRRHMFQGLLVRHDVARWKSRGREGRQCDHTC